MRYSLLAGGKRIRPVLALAHRRARSARDAGERAAARRRARADPHLLADPRRPAGDGRRRPAPRPADLPRRVRRGRRDPRRRRRSSPRRSAWSLAEQAGEPAARAGARSPSWPPRPASTGMVGGQYIDVAGDGADGAEGLRRLHALKTGRLIGASRRVRTAARGHADEPGSSRYRAFAARARRPLPDRRRHPRRHRHRRGSSASPRAATSGTASSPTSACSGSTAPASWPLSLTPQAREALARDRRPAETRATCAGITDFIARRDRADNRTSQRSSTSRCSTASTAPQDLHGLSDEQLQQVAQEVREHIIDTIGEIGGHFGANLGTCELAVALHSLLDSPRDKILWDVGHQAYPHKILTGRRDQLPTIRQYERPRAVLLDRRVRARHHGRRPRLDLDRLRGRPQGGDAPRASARTARSSP